MIFDTKRREKIKELYRMAMAYEYGSEVCSRNVGKAIEYYRILADMGESQAAQKIRELSPEVVTESNVTVSGKYQSSRDNNGSLNNPQNSQLYEMAQRFEYGTDVCAKNLNRAIEYYKILADKGEEIAVRKLKELGVSYRAEIPSNKADSDNSRPSMCSTRFDVGRRSGKVKELYRMANAYEHGSEVCSRNIGKAIEYYRILADMGESQAAQKICELSPAVVTKPNVTASGKYQSNIVDIECLNNLQNLQFAKFDIGENPREIYQNVLVQFNRFVDDLDTKLKNTCNRQIRENIVDLIDDSNVRREELKDRINSLEKNAEWDKFVIAFYGETNAGKSTIIETLRILLKEKTKVDERTSGKYDGEIIGDGRPDFTKKNVSYECEIGKEKFVLEDVPGIEGKEHEVIEEILKAVRKAHVVFYITRLQQKPQEGTLKKIREHLQEQTEVWTIYNYSVNSPMQLKEVNRKDDVDQLQEIHQTLHEIVGEERYMGEIRLSALPAFVSVAKSLSPDSRNANVKEKFLVKFTPEQILDKSGFTEFLGRFENNIISDCKRKIKKANYNKVIKLIEQYVVEVDGKLKKNEDDRIKMIDSYDKFRKKVDNEFNVSKRQFSDAVKDAVRRWKNDKVSDWYKKIEQGIVDSDLEQQLGNGIAVDDLNEYIADACEKVKCRFNDEIESLERGYFDSLEKSFGTNNFLSSQVLNCV